jgi:signal transduction histidine kinase
MTGMIEDLLAAASIEAGRLSVEQRRLDAAPLISEAVEALQPVAASKSVRLRSELPADLPAIHADGARLEQALVNLLDNAIKFTPEGGAVTVRAVPSGGMVTFSVADAGPGIAEAELPRLFERFWQARRTARQGTGLGLFIVKGIVDAHRGKVWAESKPGEGSTFFFSIPLAPPGAEQPARAPAEDPKARGEVPGRAPGSLQPEGGGQAAGRETLVQETEQRKRELHAAVESARVARELAERAGELRRDFTCLVSHELRGPLTALELLIERLERDRDAPPTPRQEIVIRRMFAAVARLTAIVESLLQHALLRSGRMTSQIEDFSTRALAAGVVEELRSYAEGKGLDLRLAAPDDLPPLRSDPVLVRLIFQNLIGNAIKFTERGLVQVSVDCTAGVHRFAVRDSGPGIPAADQARLFEPFMQTGDAKQKHVPGMGLGLTLVREVALALGGHVELDSEVGRGSTFTVTLPPVAQESREQGVPLH